MASSKRSRRLTAPPPHDGAQSQPTTRHPSVCICHRCTQQREMGIGATYWWSVEQLAAGDDPNAVVGEWGRLLAEGAAMVKRTR